MSSLLFQGVGIISVFFICASIVIFCLKTHPSMRVPVIHNVTVASSPNETAWTLDKHGTNAHDAFFYLECLCNAWFTFELLIRSGLGLSQTIKGNLFGPFSTLKDKQNYKKNVKSPFKLLPFYKV